MSAAKKIKNSMIVGTALFAVLGGNLVIADPNTGSSEQKQQLTPSILGSAYMEICEISPAQLRYSSQNVREKMEIKIKQGKVHWNEEKSCWELQCNEGRSLLSIHEALPVVKASFGYVLVDGHHDVIMSLAMDAKHVPVKIVADLSAFSEEEFWNEAEKRGMAYLYDIQGQRRIPPRDFFQLQDDPNRFFAALSARKYPKYGDLNNSHGAEYPLWIKVGKDVPFIEFQIADALWKNGVVYNYEMGRNPPEEFIEKARQVLSEAHIKELRVVTERTHYSELPK